MKPMSTDRFLAVLGELTDYKTDWLVWPDGARILRYRGTGECPLCFVARRMSRDDRKWRNDGYLQAAKAIGLSKASAVIIAGASDGSAAFVAMRRRMLEVITQQGSIDA